MAKPDELPELPSAGLARANVEAMAEVWSRASGYKPTMRLDEVVAKFGGRLLTCDNLEDLEQGSIEIRGKKDFDVRIPNFTSAQDDRFTVAHELGHYVLHYIWRMSESGKDIATPLRASRYGNGPAEAEANWFAAAFLMPESELRHAWKQNPSIATVARNFSVSIADAYLRAKWLRLIA